MKQEQRLLVAFVLIAGILALWSALLPTEKLPVHRPSETAVETKPAALVAKEGEETEDLLLGQVTFGMGRSRGGIGTLLIGKEPLLEKSSPGLLEIAWGQLNPEPVPLQSRSEGGKIVSEGMVPNEQIQIRREIRPAPESPYRFYGTLEAINKATEPKRLYLQMVTYRPLHSSDPSHREAGGNLYLNGKETAISVGRGQQKRYAGTPDWIASHGKSYTAIVQIPGKEGMFHVEHSAHSDPVGFLELPSQEIPPGGKIQWEFPLYIGPLSLASLRQVGLEEALSFGAFSGTARWLLGFLDWIYNHIHNYGLAICLLSVAVWLPFSPLTWYGRWLSAKTMKQMAQLKPQEVRIRQEHKSNPDQMQKELMQLYRKHGVNPASGCMGCLPFLFTWPIYIALFQVLTRAPELRGASFLWIRDLSGPDGMIPLPFEIPLVGNRLNVLPIAATIATYFQQALMQPPDPAGISPEQKAQQDMMKFFPIMFLFIFYRLPSGFMLYWVVNSVLTVAQQIAADRLAKARA